MRGQLGAEQGLCTYGPGFARCQQCHRAGSGEHAPCNETGGKSSESSQGEAGATGAVGARDPLHPWGSKTGPVLGLFAMRGLYRYNPRC